MPARKKTREPVWMHYSDEQLLDMRFCDLRLTLKYSHIARHLQQLYQELDRRQLKFRPHIWLADEWFSPDGVPGFTIPFYLAHPRLARLERKMMREVEGGNRNWLMRILRHETGHAFDTAYRLRRRKDWRQTFGFASRSYPKAYRPKLYSRHFVLHLGHWYAQAHPTEDFAETFAVWLQSRSSWRRQYADWPALKKLQYVDETMKTLACEKPAVIARDVIEPLAENTRTLREHYRRELKRYSIDVTSAYDADLLKVFACRSHDKTGKRSKSAVRMLRSWRSQLTKRLVAREQLHPYLIHNIMRSVIDRCRELDLVATKPTIECKQKVTRLIERILFDMMYRRRQQYAL